MTFQIALYGSFRDILGQFILDKGFEGLCLCPFQFTFNVLLIYFYHPINVHYSSACKNYACPVNHVIIYMVLKTTIAVKHFALAVIRTSFEIAVTTSLYWP